MKLFLKVLCMSILVVTMAAVAEAHFGMIIPSDNMVMQQDPRTIQVTLSFSHPMEMIGMDMAKPKVFAVAVNDRRQDLRDQLKPVTVMGRAAWQMDYAVKRPGVYAFYMEPEPYWEAAEDSYIVHITKTMVAAFGDEEGWDAELGLKTEIVPLSRPFGLYAGNLFQGVVKFNGKPVPFAPVEVEYFNMARKVTAPTEYMATQMTKADGNGVFSFAVPQGGWWGFAALHQADFKLKHDGEDKEVELGAVLWVHFEKWAGN